MPPPYIYTNPPDSFAGRTFRVRIPAILDQVLENNPFPEIRRAVAAFKQNLISGTVQDPFTDGALPDRFDPEEMTGWKQEILQQNRKAKTSLNSTALLSEPLPKNTRTKRL